MMEKTEYIRKLFVKEDEVLASIDKKLAKRGLPLISVPKEVGYTLYWLVRLVQPKRILEIGTLGGYSTIWLARALPEQGKLISIERKEEHRRLALENIIEAGLSSKVEIVIGNASDVLQMLLKKEERFDFFFIDADKVNYVEYLEKAIQLAQPGAVIAMDNLFLSGRIWDDNDQNPAPQAVRKVNQKLASDPRLESLLLPIGDGLGLARVKE